MHVTYMYMQLSVHVCVVPVSTYHWEEETDGGISRNFPAQVSVQEVYIMHELILYATCCIGRFHLKHSQIVRHARSPSSPFRG